MRYAATFIIELHYDESQKCDKDVEECMHVKIFFNEIELFSELSYCDYKTEKCPFKKFK